MSNDPNTHSHIVKYSTYLFVLLGLITLTITSWAVTRVEVGHLAVTVALLIAGVKSSLVLWHFMHLKYEKKVIIAMVGMVLFLFVCVLLVTFIDYSTR